MSFFRFLLESREIVEEDVQLVAHHTQTIMQVSESVALGFIMCSRFILDCFLLRGPVPSSVVGGVRRVMVCVGGMGGIMRLMRGIHVLLFCVMEEVFLDLRDPFVVVAVVSVLVFLAVGDLFAVFELVDYEGGGFKGVRGLRRGGCETEVVAVGEVNLLQCQLGDGRGEGKCMYLVRLETMSPINFNLKSPARLSNFDMYKMSRIPVVQIATRESQVINVVMVFETDALVVQKCPQASLPSVLPNGQNQPIKLPNGIQ